MRSYCLCGALLCRHQIIGYRAHTKHQRPPHPPPQAFPPFHRNLREMGLLKGLFKTAVYGTAVAAGTYGLCTRKTQFVHKSFTEEVMKTDDIFKSPHWLRLNPHKNVPLYDLCVRKVPLSKIKPELLEDPSALTTAFCAGMWSGKGRFISSPHPIFPFRCASHTLLFFFFFLFPRKS